MPSAFTANFEAIDLTKAYDQHFQWEFSNESFTVNVA